MTHVPIRQVRTGIDIVTVSPDAILSFLALAGIVFIPMLGSLGAMLFLGSGSIMLIRHWAKIIPLMIRYWFVFLVPAICIASFLWSQYPALSLRFGIQLTATFLIAIMIATQISAQTFSRSLFVLLGLNMIASVLIGDVRSYDGAWLGIYGSKNSLAGAAAAFTVICTSQILDSRASYGYRLVAFFGFFLGAILLLLAQSVGALILVPPAIMLQLALLVMHRLSLVQRVVVLTAVFLLTVLVVLLITTYSDVILGALLDATGKDLTLTGRTDLWQSALELINEKPWLGLGYQAFWVRGNPAAEAFWYTFGIASRTGFSFHNTYLSNAVEIGILGVGAQVIVLYGAAILNGRWAIRTRNPDASLYFGLLILVIMHSLGEVVVFYQFSQTSVIVICAMIFGLQASERGC